MAGPWSANLGRIARRADVVPFRAVPPRVQDRGPAPRPDGAKLVRSPSMRRISAATQASDGGDLAAAAATGIAPAGTRSGEGASVAGTMVRQHRSAARIVWCWRAMGSAP